MQIAGSRSDEVATTIPAAWPAAPRSRCRAELLRPATSDSPSITYSVTGPTSSFDARSRSVGSDSSRSMATIDPQSAVPEASSCLSPPLGWSRVCGSHFAQSHALGSASGTRTAMRKSAGPWCTAAGNKESRYAEGVRPLPHDADDPAIREVDPDRGIVETSRRFKDLDDVRVGLPMSVRPRAADMPSLHTQRIAEGSPHVPGDAPKGGRSVQLLFEQPRQDLASSGADVSIRLWMNPARKP